MVLEERTWSKVHRLTCLDNISRSDIMSFVHEFKTMNFIEFYVHGNYTLQVKDQSSPACFITQPLPALIRSLGYRRLWTWSRTWGHESAAARCLTPCCPWWVTAHCRINLHVRRRAKPHRKYGAVPSSIWAKRLFPMDGLIDGTAVRPDGKSKAAVRCDQ